MLIKNSPLPTLGSTTMFRVGPTLTTKTWRDVVVSGGCPGCTSGPADSGFRAKRETTPHAYDMVGEVRPTQKCKEYDAPDDTRDPKAWSL